jgi:hypothetical protein
MDEFVWEDPEPRHTSRHADAALKLRARPDTWAMVSLHKSPNAVHSAASQINGPGTPSFPRGEFRASARVVTKEDGSKECRLYVKYVGSQTEEESGMET